MHDPNLILLLVVVLAAWTALNLRRALTAGRARSRRGAVTRDHQPGRYWRYVYADWAVLAFCAAIFVAVISWPDFFRRQFAAWTPRAARFRRRIMIWTSLSKQQCSQ
jgi:hypothetical protein